MYLDNYCLDFFGIFCGGLNQRLGGWGGFTHFLFSNWEMIHFDSLIFFNWQLGLVQPSTR